MPPRRSTRTASAATAAATTPDKGSKRKSNSAAEEGTEAATTSLATKAKGKPSAKAAKAVKTKAADDSDAESAVSSPPPPPPKKKAKVAATAADAGTTKAQRKPAAKRIAQANDAAAAAAAADDATKPSPAAPTSKEDLTSFPGCPLNTTIPSPLVLDSTPRPSSSMRIAAWNIVSLKSAEPKGLVRYLEAEDADIVVLSETKVNEAPAFFQRERYPHQAWGIGSDGAKKGYAGVAVLSKVKPLSVVKGIPASASAGADGEEGKPWDYETKSRCLTLEFARCFVVGTYCVNAGEGLKSLETKTRWQASLARHIAALDERKPVIWTGDLNVVLDERDLSKARQKWNKSAGYTAAECDAHRAFLAGGSEAVRAFGAGAGAGAEGAPPPQPFTDIWREKHPEEKGHFTYYGWRGMCRSKGIGWRIDSFIISKRLAQQGQCTACEIRHDVYGASDHVPIYADFDAGLFSGGGGGDDVES